MQSQSKSAVTICRWTVKFASAFERQVKNKASILPHAETQFMLIRAFVQKNYKKLSKIGL